MDYSLEYIKELENLIQDDLLPGYIQNCRSKGVDPKTNSIISRMLDAQKYKKEVPALLRGFK